MCFRKFRNNSLNNYGLCRSHCLSAPDSSKDAIVKITKMDLELIPDLDMFILFEKGTRGGVFYVSNRYSKASNQYLKLYYPNEELNHIIYLDANNLYDYAMSKFLRTSESKRIDLKEFGLNKYIDNRSKRCAVEVHLEY